MIKQKMPILISFQSLAFLMILVCAFFILKSHNSNYHLNTINAKEVLKTQQKADNEPAHIQNYSTSKTVWGASWNKSETQILTWSSDKTARVWNTETGTLVFTFMHKGPVLSAKWNQDETQILTWGFDGQPRIT